jgi:rubrerythrin
LARKNTAIIDNLLKNLIDMETNLSGLYLVLSIKCKGTVSAAFKKISIDSMNHGVTLRLIKGELVKNVSFSIPNSELLEITQRSKDISDQAKRVIDELKGVNKVDEHTLVQLNKLEQCEEDALGIYVKFYKSYISSNCSEKIVPQLIEGIINDEKEHSRLLQIV